MRIAINGMGRIGRLLFRRLVTEPGIEVVAVNDIMDLSNLAYLIRYDSLYGRFDGKLTQEGNNFNYCGLTIYGFREPDPAALPWKELDIDIVLECSGRFSNAAAASLHRKAGAKKVLLSTTGSPDIPLLIYGFNHHRLNNDVHIVSPGGCMTNCSTHILYLLNAIGIESAHINILHSYTSRQELVDTAHQQFRRGRAAAESIIPVEIDLVHSLERLLPPLEKRLHALSIRVPVTNGALADFTVQLSQSSSEDTINQIFSEAANGEYKGIIEYSVEPLVSADIRGNIHSAIIDSSLTSITGKQVKIIAWFDNEYGYTSRIIDWLHYWKSMESF